MALFSVKNKVCCVTGAGRGIGYELSTALKKNGAFVVGVDLKYPKKNYIIDIYQYLNLLNNFFSSKENFFFPLPSILGIFLITLIRSLIPSSEREAA